MNAAERKVSGSVSIVLMPMTDSRWRSDSAIASETAATDAPTSMAQSVSTAKPTMPPWNRAPSSSASRR